jgi:PIN domain nuclease of toxin-antitoxin system
VSGDRYLIDTHVLLWALNGDQRLSASHAKLLDDPSVKFVSAATLWEIAIKARTGKLMVPDGIVGILRKASVGVLDVTAEHALHTLNLPLHHRDPFDRLLVAQAQIEELILMSDDQAIALYDVRTVA